MKRFISFMTAFVMIVSMLLYLPLNKYMIVYARDTAYMNWRQGDEQWRWSPLGDLCNMGDSGCLITSIAILMVHSGSEPNDRSKFNPGILRDRYENGGFISHDPENKSNDGNLYSSAYSRYNSPNFYIDSEDDEFDPYDYNTIYAKINSLLNQGYYIIVGVNNNGHWVAVDRCDNGEVYYNSERRS